MTPQYIFYGKLLYFILQLFQDIDYQYVYDLGLDDEYFSSGAQQYKEMRSSVKRVRFSSCDNYNLANSEVINDIQICTNDQQISQMLQHWGGMQLSNCPLVESYDKPMPTYTKHYQMNLFNIIKNPASAEGDLLYEDSVCVFLKDKYPKAKHHSIVVAKDRRLVSIYQLQKRDSQLLLHMREIGKRWIVNQLQLSVEDFRMGFHCVPTKKQLHLHIISTDFISDGLKKNKHWNSFATPYLIGFWVVYNQLMRCGKIRVDLESAEKLSKTDLRCFKCGEAFYGFNALKKHLLSPCLNGVQIFSKYQSDV
eukprot:TRINITY_DN17177_c0_g1_i3.p1 TRINITY_DN17177_c0_g1~~TRINITY_DN17177_c0_g1_i3.p1  ORF type:complete len:308 (-),score=1.77 TRINITY_DN17177_c0_g1_i3:342-1265(-)